LVIYPDHCRSSVISLKTSTVAKRRNRAKANLNDTKPNPRWILLLTRKTISTPFLLLFHILATFFFSYAKDIKSATEFWIFFIPFLFLILLFL